METEKIRAKRLETSACIGVFSASSPISATVPIRYERGKAFLESKGFKVKNGLLYGKQDAYRSGSIKERAEEFNNLLYDDEIKVIMSSIGGFVTNSILPYIDYDYLKKHPKIIIGYSDTTALLLAIYKNTGLVTFYGPALAASFGEFPPFVDFTYDRFKEMLCTDITVPYSFPIPPMWTDEFISWKDQKNSKKGRENDWICVNKGECRGRLIGGNLNTMYGIFGTEYMPDIKEGDILFIEDSLKNASTIERSFSLLKLAGVFDKVSGIILGKHELFDDEGSGKQPYEILLEVLDGAKIPSLADFDCCHTHPMLTMPIGCNVELNATEKRVTLLEKPVI